MLKKRIVQRWAALLFAVALVFHISVSVSASMVDDGFSGDAEKYWALVKYTVAVEAYRSLLENLSSERDTWTEDYSFWLPDLDGNVVPELIVSILTPTMEEKLLVYGMESTGTGNGTGIAALLFETDPPVPIRYGFQMTQDGKAVYSAVVSPGTGEVQEGLVTLNEEKTGLEYEKTNEYSLAQEETSKYAGESVDVSGYYSTGEYMDWGPLEMERISRHGFELGTDNVSFGHNIGQEVSGLKEGTKRRVTEAQYKALTENRSKSWKAAVDDYLGEEQEGICFGLSSTMALIKMGKLSASALEPEAQTTFELKKPYFEDANLYCSLNYIHFLQHDVAIEKGATVKPHSLFGMSDELEGLINCLSGDEWYSLCYFAKHEDGSTSGHAVLALGVDYFQSLGVYRVTLYDVNSLTDDTRQGYLSYLFVRDDDSDFIMKDGGSLKTSSNTDRLYLLSIDDLWEVVDPSLLSGDGETQHRIYVPQEEVDEAVATLMYNTAMDNWFLEVPGKGRLTVEDGEIDFTDPEDVRKHLDIDLPAGVVYDGLEGKAYGKAVIPAGEGYTLTCNGPVDIKIISGDDDYYTLKADYAETVTFSGGNIQVSEAKGSFEAGTISGEKLIKVCGTAASGFSLLTDGTLQFQADAAAEISQVMVLGDNDNQYYDVQGSLRELSVTGNGPETESREPEHQKTGASLLILGAAAGILVIGAAVVLIVRRKKA